MDSVGTGADASGGRLVPAAAPRPRPMPPWTTDPVHVLEERSRQAPAPAALPARRGEVARGSTTTMSSSPSQAARCRSSAASSSAVSARRARLGVRRLDQQRPGLPVGLEVDPADDPVPEQERKHVVAERRLGSGRRSRSGSGSRRSCSVRSRSHTTGSNGLSSARASTLRAARHRGAARPAVPALDASPAAAHRPRPARRSPLGASAFTALELKAVVVEQATQRWRRRGYGGCAADELLAASCRVGTGGVEHRARAAPARAGRRPARTGSCARRWPGHREVEVVERLPGLRPVPAPVDLCRGRPSSRSRGGGAPASRTSEADSTSSGWSSPCPHVARFAVAPIR